MDDDLRDLERRAATDPSLRERLHQVRRRAGVDVVTLLVGVRRAEVDLTAARATYARSMAHAFRTFLSAAFDEHPGLNGFDVRWCLRERTGDEPLTVRFDVDDLRERKLANHLDPATRAAVVEALLRFAPLLASQHDARGARRIERDADGRVQVVVHEETSRRRAGATPTTRDAPFRQIEDLTEPLRDLRSVYEASGIVPRPGATRAALAIAEGADADLGAATAEFLAQVRPVWQAFVPSFFVENAGVDVLAVYGFVSGYNDNWYDEHEQHFHVGKTELAYLLEEALQQGHDAADLARAGLVLPRGDVDRPLHDQLAAVQVFRTFLRLEHGPSWLLVLSRERGAQVLRGWRS